MTVLALINFRGMKESVALNMGLTTIELWLFARALTGSAEPIDPAKLVD